MYNEYDDKLDLLYDNKYYLTDYYLILFKMVNMVNLYLFMILKIIINYIFFILYVI